ncbi:potassium-transporting ATPase subunit KdpC [Bacillus subtilis]|nr:potassium-transporting ATPase subunit KdpC [Bacillus subtilis]MBT2222964.1 potassium-transporting ATPase subunit KdpC [Bacillus subtilis]QAR92944.1 potassium-transporting ATPase subunit KdpC [Bacillus subtilis]QAT36556.1 potassium-transporting ATPase subunit KdpC [Bacillus subtilis]QHH20348.1 potassium-transporting ATPase subunit KdpC [Bacillus subtilis]
MIKNTGGLTLLKIIRLALLMIIICGILYPLLMTGLAQAIFPDQANGSILKNKDGQIVGSELIGQQFTKSNYFQGRISSIKYNAVGSGSNNYGPTNQEMLERTKSFIRVLEEGNPDLKTKELPIDLITNSGSGLDPDISVKAAKFQVNRVSNATGVSESTLNKLIDNTIDGRSLGIFGEPRVNVLKLNMKVQEIISKGN